MKVLALAAFVFLAGHGDGDERQSRNRPGNDCNDNRGECSDDDQLVVVVCPEGCVRAPER